MHKINIALCFTVLFMIYGCAGSPYRIARMSSEELSGINDLRLCMSYGVMVSSGKSRKISSEIKKRDLIPDGDWSLVTRGKVGIGMSECAMLASWGRPSTVNKTISRSGSRKQYVFRPASSYYASAQYVYVENGIVTTVQGRQ